VSEEMMRIFGALGFMSVPPAAAGG